MNKIVNVSGVSLNYQAKNGEIQAISDISMDIFEGEFVSIVGPSGCGKSTLLSIICGLLPPSGGAVYIAGEPVRGPSPLIGFMPQKDHLFPWRTVYENVRLGLDIHCEFTPETAAYLDRLLETYGLFEFRDKYPSQLSGGMRQRVMIAMALACNPKIIIADEPTTALDVTIQAQILDLLRQLKDKINSSIMLITHDLGVIAEMADYVVVMYAGRIVEKGTAEEIFAHPCHPYTIGLMASKPVVGKKVDKLYSIPGKVPNPVDMPDYCYFKDRCEMQLDCCTGEYPCEISVSPTHKVSCYRYYKENRRAGE